jgi:hypothetical protein
MMDGRPDNAPSDSAIERLTLLEQALWSKPIKRQYESKDSRYWKNVGKYGNVGSTFISAAILWLIPAYPLVLVVILGLALNIPFLVVISVIGAVLLCLISTLRNLSAFREGKLFREGLAKKG